MNNRGREEWRVFCAVELPAEIRSRIAKHIELLRAGVPTCQPSWTRVDNIHLTLKFFGNVDIARVNLISVALSRAAQDFPPFQISIAGAGAFPKPNYPRVLWIGVDDLSNRLMSLYERIEEECANAGFEKDTRDFRPHLTVARIRDDNGARKLAEVNQILGFESMQMSVGELLLFRSELSSKGSNYTVVSRHKLSAMSDML